jgi:hypothetical protein
MRKMRKKKSTMNCMVGSMAHDIVFTNSICNDVLTKRWIYANLYVFTKFGPSKK